MGKLGDGFSEILDVIFLIFFCKSKVISKLKVEKCKKEKNVFLKTVLALHQGISGDIAGGTK